MTEPDPATRIDRNVATFMGVVLTSLIVSYLSVFLRLSRLWSINPDYSHGFLVPFFSGYLMYRSREHWLPLVESAKPWWSVALGVGLIAIGLALRVTGILGRALPVEGFSFPVVLAGVLCVLGGVRAVYINLAAVVFLCFMLPIPSHVNRILRGELQKVATQGSVLALQTMGVPTVNQGNVLTLPNSEVGVVEACSGLRILASLGAMAFAICVLLEKSWLNRGLILLSVLPIAIFVNIVRVVVTALGHEYWPSNAERIHDAAGWMMILLSVALLVLVQKYLAALFPSEPVEELRQSERVGGGKVVTA